MSNSLYRHFDASGSLLYVGVSLNHPARLAKHASASHWFHQIARVDVEHFQSRDEAEAAEGRAIRSELPKYNIAKRKEPRAATKVNIAQIYDDAQKRAAFHAAALEPTGEATPAQKRNRGRPSVYREPEGEARAMALEWWAGPLHTDDVCKLIGQMMKTPTPSRPTVVAWLGPRPKHEGRARKPRSDKRN